MKGLTHKQTAELKDAMREYKAQGHTMQEVADYFGYSYATTEKTCRGVAPQKPKQYKNQYINGSFDREANAREMVDERTPWFEYAGNFTGADGTVDLKCRTCGTVTTKSCVTVRHRKATCENCAHIESEKRKAHKKLVEAQKKEWEKIGKAKSEQLSFSVCKCCGNLFFSKRKGVQYCSTACQTKLKDAIKKDRRIRKLRSIAIDKDITIEKLYTKSNGVCALCGGQCDWSDHVINDGTFVVGAMYPSIDHVKPISKGGLHEWSNVQLAHFSCNSKKGDRV